jgi:hypothetical protein
LLQIFCRLLDEPKSMQFMIAVYGLWSGLAVGLAAVALMLTFRLHFCASAAIAPGLSP